MTAGGSLASGPAALETGWAQTIDRLSADVRQLQSLELGTIDGRSGPALHAALGRLAGQLGAVAARVLARVEEDGRWQGNGSRTFGEWVARREGLSVGTARREAELGRALEALPRTATAVADGSMSLEHAQVLARHGASSSARMAALSSADPQVNEGALVQQAQRLGSDDFRRVVQRWAHRVDEAAAEVEHGRACAKEHLSLVRRADGVILQGFLTHEHGEVLVLALRAVSGVPAADDPRSRDERQAAALVDSARLVLDRGLAGAGQQVRPHLSVHVSLDALQRRLHSAAEQDGDDAADWLPAGWRDWVAGGEATAPAELDDGTPIPPSLLARLACDSEITRIVFGPAGDVLDVGRAQRTFTGQQRRGVIARDRSCRFPGCGAPPTLGEVHHVAWWTRDHGPTAVDNGILLCWYHHDLVHRRVIGIHRDDGGWRFRRPDGTHVRAGGGVAGEGVAGAEGIAPAGERPARRDGPPGEQGTLALSA